MNQSLFHQLKHPFVWTTPADRAEVLANVNEPLWHRFLEEAELHFTNVGELRHAKFPVFCHDGDLDEVMAVSVLAYVRDDRRYWRWVADWLRSLLAYYREVEPRWRENRSRILRGEQPTPFSKDNPNPRQFFEGFTRGGMYWVEAGLTSVVLHLVDLLEAYAPDELSVAEKAGVLEAVGSYADRYAFHEEAFKYNNRGMWSNAGVLLAAIAHANPQTGQLLRFQAARRNDEFRSTFLDDGFHVEGAADYHLMAADGLLSYTLTASHLGETSDLFAGKSGTELFQCYPPFADIARAYLRTVIPGPVLWNHSRGCSMFKPMMIRPALFWAWKLTHDPEIGWFLRQQMETDVSSDPTPLPVTRSALLGLGEYQPLWNFWLYRPVDSIHPPVRACDVLPDHGGLFSRSGWEDAASCVTARFGYEGTGKGHRDHAHVTLTVGGVHVLKDPFPRVGPPGLESSPFHNTVTLDNAEPASVIGSLQSSLPAKGMDAFLISNSGGLLPHRIFLHDPRDETHYWFTNAPETANFNFQRAILHLHHRCVILVDRIVADSTRRIDWFFHSDLSPVGYDPFAIPRFDNYQLRQRNVATPASILKVALRGEIRTVRREDWGEMLMEGMPLHASIRMMSPDASLQIEQGHWDQAEKRTSDGISLQGEVDYFLRIRTEASVVHAVWVVAWGGEAPVVRVSKEESLCKIHVDHLGSSLDWSVDFDHGSMNLREASPH